MTQTAKRIISGSTLTGSAVTYYTAPAATTTVIKKLLLVNTTGGALACTVYLVPSGGTAGTTNTITSAYSVAAGQSYAVPEAENMVLAPAGFIQAFGSGVTILAAGIEIV